MALAVPARENLWREARVCQNAWAPVAAVLWLRQEPGEMVVQVCHQEGEAEAAVVRPSNRDR